MTAERPTEGSPSLIFREPFSAKNEATRSGSFPHHAAVYRVAKSFIRVSSIVISAGAPKSGAASSARTNADGRM